MSSPHDALFKATFSQLEHARSELQHVLPPALSRAVDWESLAAVPGTFIDDELAHSACDLLFTARMAEREACIYLLFERQSTVDTLMPFRLLRYMVRIWDHWLQRNHGARLPLVVPVVLHHSSTGWTGPMHLLERVDISGELAAIASPYVPDFTFVLDDLAKMDEQALRARAVTELVRLTQVMLQHCRGAADPVPVLSRWFDTFVAVLTAPHGAQAIQALASYTLQATEGRPQDIRTFFQGLGPPAEEAFVTAADQIIEQNRGKFIEEGLKEGLAKGRLQGLAEGRVEGQAEGRVEGQAEGRVEGQAILLLRQLQRRFGPLPLEVQGRVKAASPEQLEVWSDRVLTEASLAEVIGDPHP